jgi:putative resolvase
MIGISVRTLQRWDIYGKLITHRTSSGRRFYTERQYQAYMEIQPEPEGRKTICYTRVSGNNQKKDLQNQVSALETFVVSRGISVDVWLSDIGSGLNYKRKNFCGIDEDG